MSEHTSLHQPHDRFTKAALGHQQVATELFQQYLPANIRDRIDFETLTLWQNQLTQEDLQKLATDMVFHAQQKDGKTCLCLLHCEQSREPDREMPLRILRYKSNQWMQYMRQSPKESLPPIFSLVIYNGHKPYPYETDLVSLFAEPNLAEESLLDAMKLIDLSSTSDKALMKTPWSGGLLGTLKHAGRESLPEFIQTELADCLNTFEKADKRSYITSITRYIYDQSSLSTQEMFHRLISGQVLPEVEITMMSLADNLRQEGLHKGRQEGRQEGVIEGRVQMALALAKKGLLSLKEIAGISGIPYQQLSDLVSKQRTSAAAN